jgi:hypothetical protein
VLIRGTVVDLSGAPVRWAAVWVAAGPGPTPDIAAMTDTTGTFVLTAARSGKYRIGCRAEGLATEEIEIDVGSGDVDVEISLAPR